MCKRAVGVLVFIPTLCKESKTTANKLLDTNLKDFVKYYDEIGGIDLIHRTYEYVATL